MKLIKMIIQLLLISIILIIIGVVFLIYGSELFVSSAINFANRFNISEAVIGLSLIAFGTSLPELVVGIMSDILGSAFKILNPLLIKANSITPAIDLQTAPEPP